MRTYVLGPGCMMNVTQYLLRYAPENGWAMQAGFAVTETDDACAFEREGTVLETTRRRLVGTPNTDEFHSTKSEL
jgi:hypothetical protein